MENRDKAAVILTGGRMVQRQVDAPERRNMTCAELAEMLPADIASEAAFSAWSSQPLTSYTLRMCSDVAHLAASKVNEGAKGVVITADIQAISELAYFADLVWNFPQPLIFTTSAFYADSPASETAVRLTQSLRAAMSDVCWGKGVLICADNALFAASEADCISNFRYPHFAVHNIGPTAIFSEPSGSIMILRTVKRAQILDIDTVPVRTISILTASVGGGDIMLNALLDKRINELEGLVIAGFGDGDVPPSWVPLLRKVMRAEVPIVLASRCPDGRVQSVDSFDGSASQLLEMGIMSAGSLTPQQARIRLALGLGAGLKGADLSNYIRAV